MAVSKEKGGTAKALEKKVGTPLDKRPAYEAPVVMPLGQLARGFGGCFAGSADATCWTGSAAAEGCVDGGTASSGCLVGAAL